MDSDLTKLSFVLEDEVDGKPLSPETISLPQLSNFLDEVEKFIKGDLSSVTLADSRVKIHSGSVAVAVEVGEGIGSNVRHDLEILKDTGDLDQIDEKRAQIMERWQNRAARSQKRRYSVGSGPIVLRIFDASHYEHGSEKSWVSVEKYFSGKIYNAGGKQDPNVHVELEDGRTIKVDATEGQLATLKDNLLFKSMTLRVQGQQHLWTKALRDLRLIEFLPHSSEVNDQELAALWDKGREAWKEVDSASEWVEKLRGNK